MTENERPLPRPPKTPFGKRRPGEEDSGQELIADKMAEAAAMGKLDEYLERELPDSEEARALARMMMAMTGMMPAGSTPRRPGQEIPAGPAPEPAADVSPDVMKAVHGGDVKGLMDILRREHGKRSPEDHAGSPPAEGAVAPVEPGGQPQPAIDKELIDALIRIAADNSVTLDWIILRAIKVYVEEYRKTGKL